MSVTSVYWIHCLDLLPTLEYAGIDINTQACEMTHGASTSTHAPFPDADNVSHIFTDV